MTVLVVGAGKIGLPLAAMFADAGRRVVVSDLDRAIIDKVSKGISPHDEPGLAERISRHVGEGRLSATTDTAAAAAQAEVVVIVVAALLTDDRDIDYASLLSACADISAGMRPGTLVSCETTLPVGGSRAKLIPALERGGLTCGRDFGYVFSPERVKSRKIFERITRTPKVIGGFDVASLTTGAEFYRTVLGAEVIEMASIEMAEFVKLAGMIYRDVNIALANELAAYAEQAGLDAWAAAAAANTDEETGLLLPGIGVGGHCTPVYPHFHMQAAARIGATTDLARAGRIVNEEQPRRQVGRLEAALGGLDGRSVHILGLAFRPEVREDAYSPAWVLASALHARGAKASLEDPIFSEAEVAARGFVPGRIGNGSHAAVVLNTAHAAYARPDFASWRKAGVLAVLDGRHLWNQRAVEDAGIIYLGVGLGA